MRQKIPGLKVNRRHFIAGSALALAGLPNAAQAATTLRVGLANLGSENLDPTVEVRGSVMQVHMAMYDSLVDIGLDNEPIPGLAESWSVDDSGLLWTFKMRKGVEFHGGYGEVTAEDAVFSLNRWMSKDVTNPVQNNLLDAVEKVDLVDSQTFTIKTRKPRATLLYLLSPHETVTGIVFSKKHLLEKGGETQAGQAKALNELPIGSGPYQFVSRQLGQSMTLAAVDSHWRVNPYIRHVEFLIVPDTSTQLLMLQSGEVDLIQLDPDRAAQIGDSGHAEVRKVPQARDFCLYICGTFGEPAQSLPTSNVLVRKALSKAINRNELIDTLMDGNATLPTVPWGIGSEADGIDPAAYADWAKEIAEYDPEGAKELLAEAGYPNGFSGIKMYLINYVTNLQNSTQLSLAIAAQWAKIDVHVEPVTIDYTTLRPYLVGDPDDPYLSGHIMPFTGSVRFTVEALLSVVYTSPPGRGAQMIRNEELNAIADQISVTLDDKARTDLGTQAMKMVLDQWVTPPILSADELFGVNKAVVGPWTARPGYPFICRLIESMERPA